ncbi:S41 family peptidase [Myxococcota bacterium]|nr:S41 family peptidase [Myxococcota bacterium]
MVIIFAVSACGESKRKKSRKRSATTEEFNTPDPELLKDLRFPELVMTLTELQKNYYDPTKLKAPQMLEAGLEQLQTSISSIAWKKNAEVVTVEVDQAVKKFDVKKMLSLGHLRDKGSDILEFVINELRVQGASKDEMEDALYAFINGMLAALDPYSVLIRPKLQDDFELHTKGAYGGVGMVLSVRDYELTAVNPYKDQPAYRAGLREGDKIVRIDDYSTVNMKLTDAVDLIRGEENTTVDIYARPAKSKEVKKFTVTREIINIKSVSSRLLAGNILYIRVAHFIPTTVSDINKKYKEASEKAGGKIRGIILDLVENPGGLLPQAIHVANAFVEKGVVVSTEGAPGKQKKVVNATKENTITADTPMIVLVNSGSASASEIVSGTLKNLDRALVLGETTYGKGTVQQIFSRGKGFPILKMTIRQYLTAGDVSIQQVGVVPHVRVVPVGIIDRISSLFWPDRPKQVNKRTRAIKSDKVRPEEKPRFEVRYFKTSVDKRDIKNSVDDFAAENYIVDLARKILDAAGDAKATVMLEKARKLLLNQISEEERKLVDNLKPIQVDWTRISMGTRKPDIEVTPLFCEVKDTKCVQPLGSVEPGTKTLFRLKVTNKSQAPAGRLYAIIKSDANYLDEKEFLFGKVDLGEEKQWDNEFSVPRSSGDEVEPFTVKLFERERGLIAEKRFLLKVNPVKKPALAISYTTFEKDSMGDGCPAPGENFRIAMSVKNIGEGVAKKVVMRVINHSGKRVYLETGLKIEENIEPGKETAGVFDFIVKNTDKELKLELEASDRSTRTNVSRQIVLPQCSGVKGTKPQIANININSKTDAFSTVHLKYLKAAIVEGTYSIQAMFGDACRIRLKNDIDVFVKCTDFIPVTTKVPVKIAWNPQIVPVVIRLTKKPPPVTNAATAKIAGTVEHAEKLKDFYILIYSYENETGRRKVYFQAPKDRKMTFETDLPLKKGLNNVLLIGRHDKDLFSHVLFSIVRE